MGSANGSGYLADVEANLIGIRAAPNAVFLRLSRAFAGEGKTTTMFTELTPGQTLRLIRELQASVQEALAARDNGAAGAIGVFAQAAVSST